MNIMDETTVKVVVPKINAIRQVPTPVEAPQMEMNTSSSIPVNEELKTEVKLPVGGKTEPEVHATNAKIDYTLDPLFYQIANYLGVKPQEHLVLSNKLTSIMDWAIKRAGSRDTAEVLYTIRQIERLMPTPGMDDRRYSIVYRYIKLMSERDALDKQIQSYHDREPQAELGSY